MPATDVHIQLLNLVSSSQSSKSVLSTIMESPSSLLIQSDTAEMTTIKPLQRSVSLTNDGSYHRNDNRNHEAFSSLGHINNSNSDKVSDLPLRGRNSWLATNQGATLVWRDVCVYATSTSKATSKNLRRIINNSTGAIQPGTLMAVMGSRYYTKILLAC